MKEFCIEINENQPLDKVEAKLKELGYKENDIEWNNDWSPIANYAYAYLDGTYLLHRHDSVDGSIEILTLDKL